MIQDERTKRENEDFIKKVVADYLKSAAFTGRKLTDTPTDSLQVVNRKYVNNNGPVANRPSSSVASVGQPYFATDTNIPMTYSQSGWRNGVGSVVALNN
jgi:hypothetical protein